MGDVEIKCSGMEDNIILYVDRELSETEKCGVERHLESCPKCRKLYESYAKLDKSASRLFVSERPLAKVRLEKPAAAVFMDNIREWFASPRFTFQAAALAVFIFSAFLFYRGGIGPKSTPSAVLGKFICREFQAGAGQGNFASYFGAGEIADGAMVKAIEPGAFSSGKFNVIFRSGAEAKLGSGEIMLVSGSIDIDYFKKPAPANFVITTPNSRIFIRGTKLSVSYFNSVTEISVAEGRVAIMKKDGELILGPGDGAIVKITGEPERLTGKEVHKDLKTSELELKKISDDKALDAAARSGVKPEETGTAETAVKNNGESTLPATVEKGPDEKILDYEVDLDSMDEKTRKLFFKNKPR